MYESVWAFNTSGGRWIRSTCAYMGGCLHSEAFPALVQQNSGFHLVSSEMEHLQHLRVSECKGPDLLADSYSSKDNLLLYLEEMYRDVIQTC